jgi:hypothetical protein
MEKVVAEMFQKLVISTFSIRNDIEISVFNKYWICGEAQ